MTSIEELREQLDRIKDAIAHMERALIGLEASRPEMAAPPKARRSKGRSLIPPDWQPRSIDLEWCSQSFPTVRAHDEADKFRDYWTASGKAYADWDAAFRNWCRKAAEFSKTPVTRLQGGSSGRAAILAESNRASRDRALDKLASLRQGAARSEIP